MSNFFHISNIADVHYWFGLKKPLHPLITIINKWPSIDFDFNNTKITSDLYLISMKGNVRGTFQYGRNSYDYEEGTITFLAPNQVASFNTNESTGNSDYAGWTILFHPDLIQKSELSKTIKNYSFFDYDTHEALHISEKERQILTDFVNRIKIELEQNIDKHSQDLMIINIESILKYCLRYYERQFYTRSNLNKDFIVRFEQFLKEYFESEILQEKGLPSLSQCGAALNMSGAYLSDLLKLETGKSAKYYIHNLFVKKAKALLVNTNHTISSIAYDLGFEYPQHFSKLFKSKTGLSPLEYRNLN